jgi:pSer/pThr/pTyr-binding forkhead associated (FHA) protein
MASVLISTPDGQTYEFELDSAQMSLGRGDGNHLVVPDGSISTNHGEFINEGGHWVFADLGSTNGTKINGERVDRIELGHGAQFEVGNCAVAFYDEVVQQSAPAAFGGGRRQAPTTSTGGYGEQPVDRSARIGFGAKKKAPDGGRGGVMALGIIAFLAAIGVAAMFFVAGVL